MKTRLSIDRLVLEGLPISPSARVSLSDAFAVELARLLRDQPLGTPGQDRDRSVTVVLREPLNASTIGAQVASAVHQEMVRWAG